MAEPALSRAEWIERFARLIGTEAPSEAETDALLKLAATAAHASERPAAPIACWLAGRSGRSPDELLELADRVAEGSG